MSILFKDVENGNNLQSSEGATKINMHPNCRACHSILTLEEMHFYDSGDGSATCNSCESKWMDDMQKWHDGIIDGAMPERP